MPLRRDVLIRAPANEIIAGYTAQEHRIVEHIHSATERPIKLVDGASECFQHVEVPTKPKCWMTPVIDGGQHDDTANYGTVVNIQVESCQYGQRNHKRHAQ